MHSTTGKKAHRSRKPHSSSGARRSKREYGSENRFHVLNFQQIERLHAVLESRVPVAPRPHDPCDACPDHLAPNCRCLHADERGGDVQQPPYPTVHVQLKQLIKCVKNQLQAQNIPVKEIRMNGGAAGYIIDVDSELAYSDLDLLFSVDLSDSSVYGKIKTIVLEVVAELMAATAASGNASFGSQASAARCPVYLAMDAFSLKQYIRKMVRVNKPALPDSDSWSLISLGYQTPHGGQTVELKFVHKMRRPYEFTVDSFQIVLDSLLQFYECMDRPIDEHFHPTVVAESVSGAFEEALSHLKQRVIATYRPEEIRGGGLLKYCKLLVDGYQPAAKLDILSLERFMCSRFFIDFPHLALQYTKLISYLADHFANADDAKVIYLQILHEVVSHSTVCLMTHERQQTLYLISSLMQHMLCLVRSKNNESAEYAVVVEEDAEPPVLHIPAFSTEAWTVDRIYYGTGFFPKQSYVSLGSFDEEDYLEDGELEEIEPALPTQPVEEEEEAAAAAAELDKTD